MSRYSIWIVSPPNYLHSHAFDEVAIGASRRVPRARPRRRTWSTIPRGSETSPSCSAAISLKGVAPPPPDKRLILFNLEQITPNSAWLTQDYLALLGRYPVWDYSQGNIAELAKNGHPRGALRHRLCAGADADRACA